MRGEGLVVWRLAPSCNGLYLMRCVAKCCISGVPLTTSDVVWSFRKKMSENSDKTSLVKKTP